MSNPAMIHPAPNVNRRPCTSTPLRCFGATPGAGNPALVIEHDRSSPDARQAFARERNTTCAWINPPQQGGSAASVDFYYPHTRSPLCLHATLAAAERLFMRAGAQPSLTVTAAGLRRSGTDLCHGLSLVG